MPTDDNKKENDKFDELGQWESDLRKKWPPEGVIVAVKDRMSSNPEEYRPLAFILKHLLIETGRYAEAEKLIDDVIACEHDDVRFPIAKATLHLYCLDDALGALDCINQALVRAHRTGFFRREALGDKARILLQLGRGLEFSNVLEEIMSLEMFRDIPDIGRERDFVDRAPPGMISDDLRSRYDSFCPRRGEENK